MEGGEAREPERKATQQPRDYSLLASLRARREALGRKRHLDLELPGYGGELVARYEPVPWNDISKIGERVAKSNSPRADLLGAADVLIASCAEVLTPVKGELRSLNEVVKDFGQEPVRFDERLAKAVGIEAEKAREVAIGVFGADKPESGNDTVLIDHHARVLRWLREADADADEDF